MNTLKKAIDEKIRKLQLLRELADDPDAVSLFKDLIQVSGNGHSVSTTLPTPSTGKKRGRPRRGDQQRAVEETLASAIGSVSTDWIVDTMKKNGYVFAAAKPRVAVNECLRYAEKFGRAHVAKTEGVTNYWEASKK